MSDPLSERDIALANPGCQPSAERPKGKRQRVLIAEDDEVLGRFLERYLTGEGFVTLCVSEGPAVLEMLSPAFDLVLLDLNLPRLDGLAVLQQLRTGYPALPVLVLTARAGAGMRATALSSGADDCLNKPFSPMELLARVRALLRRCTVAVPPSSECGGLTIQREELRVTRDQTRVELTPREYGLLEFLMRTPGVPVARGTLLKELWGDRQDAASNVVDVYMKYVRDKIDRPGLPKLIHTVRGVGYVVSAE